MEIDYKGELKEIIDKKDQQQQDRKDQWWRPSVGINKFQVILIGKEYTRTFGDEEVTKVRLVVKLDSGEELNWGIGKGGPGSTWGQLMIIGAAFGDIKNRDLTLVVTESGEGDKKRRVYTLLEAAELMSKKDE